MFVPTVRENVSGVIFADDGEHLRVGCAGNVVDNIRAGFKRGFGDFGFVCVDRKRELGVSSAEFRYDGNDAAKFFVGGDGHETGARRFSSYVDNVRCRTSEVRRLKREVPSAV